MSCTLRHTLIHAHIHTHTQAMSSTPQRFNDKGSLWYMAHIPQYVLRTHTLAHTHIHTHTHAHTHTQAMSSTPQRFKDKGSLWYMAHMLQYVMRPNLHLQRLILAAKRAVRWVSPSLGVHVRRGDACEKGHERLCVGSQVKKDL